MSKLVNMEAAASFMAEAWLCASRLPSERAECLGKKCACWTKTERLLTLAGVPALVAEVTASREREERRADDDALWG